MSKSAAPAELSFEAAIERLEAIVSRLEGGELDLEEALSAFEEGVGLTRHCQARLESAERRIEVLTANGAAPFAAPEEDD